MTGLILSIPIAVLTSRRDVGLAARRIGVFVTPEEAAINENVKLAATGPR